MKNLFKYKATVERYYRYEKRVKGLVQVEASNEDEARPKILKWLCDENGASEGMIEGLKVKMIPSI